MIQRLLSVGSSIASSSLGGWRGTAAFRPVSKQPEHTLVLYEFEACPYCRLVRECLTELDLDASIRPCPKNGQRFRPEAIEQSGQAQFPLLIDPNTNTMLQESDQIIDYLYREYAGRSPRRRPLQRPLNVLRSNAASLPRAARGLMARPSRAPEQELELYSFESSPFSRLARERLCELELPYRLRSTGKARWEDMGPPELRKRFFPELPVQGRNRTQLLERAGQVQVPYLVDPNTGVEMFESANILRYLDETYASQVA